MTSFVQHNKKCLRCNNVELKLLPESGDKISFYECPNCSRHYAQKPGRGICDRWRSPVSIVLYCIIFERHPQNAYQRVADYFLSEMPDAIPIMTEEIEQELTKPTQNVCDILDLSQDEKDVRAFLRLVVNYWKEKLAVKTV